MAWRNTEPDTQKKIRFKFAVQAPHCAYAQESQMMLLFTALTCCKGLQPGPFAASTN